MTRIISKLIGELLLVAVSYSSAFVIPAQKHHVGSNAALKMSSSTSMELSAGLTKTTTQEGNGMPLQLGDIATVKYSCYVPGGFTFSKSNKEKMVIGDGTMIEAWEKAIRSMQVGERSLFRVTDSELAYGNKGVPPFVPPNAVIEMDVEILDARPATQNIDFDNLGLDSTPTSPEDIARAYEARQAANAGKVKKKGLEGFIERIRTAYFFGLFGGETGQQAPWFLRPSITFPLAFLVLGAAFYISLVSGAISERGAQTKDELDEIILSSNAVVSMIVNALVLPSAAKP